MVIVPAFPEREQAAKEIVPALIMPFELLAAPMMADGVDTPRCFVESLGPVGASEYVP
jgi:hypothetical protein